MPKKTRKISESMLRDPPWLIANGETQNDYKNFQLYLYQEPPRSITILAAEAGVTARTLQNVSHRNHWKKRARDYDEWTSIKCAESEVEVRARVRLEHLRLLQLARLIAVTKFGDLIKNPNKIKKMSTRDALAYAREAVTLERLILGESTERAELLGPQVDLSRLSDDDLAAVDSILGRVSDDD